MIKLDLHDSNYFAVCKHYKQIYDTPRIKNNLQLMREALKNIVIYLLLSPYGNDQQDLLHRLSEDKNLQEIPKYKYRTVKKLGEMSV